jgi:glc operon protein GlcG
VNAIFLDDEVPEHLQQYIEINARFFRENKAESPPLSPVQAEAIVAAARRYAEAAGLRVAIAVVDKQGAPLAKSESDGIDASAPRLALDKAFTAAMLQVATHQVRGGAAANAPAGFDQSRLVTQAGGYPALDGATIIGAIGVAGALDAQLDLQCCLAGLSALQPEGPTHG